MKYEQIFREALEYFRQNFDMFPKEGFFAGGALANKIWENVSGNPAVINDLDIYYLQEIVDEENLKEDRDSMRYNKREVVIYEDYSGLRMNYLTKGSYAIGKVLTNGVLNLIDYKSTTEDRMIILDSFDLNCCQVGYDITNDKFYWTKDFIEFLETGKLKVTFLNSPAHTAIRVVKKHIDLGVELPELELDILQFANKNKFFWDSTKFRFKKKYYNMFQRYKSYLESRFEICRAVETEENLKTFLPHVDELWMLVSTDNYHTLNAPSNTIIRELSLWDSKKFLFWIRNIGGNNQREKIWKTLSNTFDINLGFDEYIDCEVNMDEIEKLGRLVFVAPDISNNLMNLTLSQQLKKVNTIFDIFPPYTAFVILEKIKIDDLSIFDNEDNRLLTALSIRTYECRNFEHKMDVYFHNKWVGDNQTFI